MKAIKLKPLFFPSDDILVEPPDILHSNNPLDEKTKNKVISSMDQLKTILRGRQLKKQYRNSKLVAEEEKESVEKLSEWKKASPVRSPKTKKFTFKKIFTLSPSSPEQKPVVRAASASKAVSPIKLNPVDFLNTAVQVIIAAERIKKKVKQEEIKKTSDLNTRHEIELKSQINKLAKEIKGLKDFIKENSQKLENAKKSFEEFTKNHEDESHSLALFEAEELLFKDKNKKTIKPGEEKKYFIKKEKIRQLKQDLHKNFLEKSEFYKNSVETYAKDIETARYQRQVFKKELQEYKDQIIMMYYTILKQGNDVRSDGLRWIIKAIWNMNEPIPISAFPKFIDEESVHFLLTLSEKDIQLEKYETSLNNLRNEIKNKRPGSAFRSAKILYSDVRKRLKDITQSSIGIPVKKNINTEESSDTNITSIKENSIAHNKVHIIRQKINEIHEYIKENINKEIKRITELYQINPGHLEEVGLFHVIRCLVGDKVREFNKYTRSSLIKNNNSVLII